MSDFVPKRILPKGTIRQEKINKLIVQGLRSYEIAQILGVSEKTIQRDMKIYVEKLPEYKDHFIRTMFEIRLGMLKETEKLYTEAKDSKSKCRAYNLKQKLTNDLEKFIARFGYIPNEKVEHSTDIPQGYVNLTELKMKAFDALEEEKRLKENEKISQTNRQLDRQR
jgi:transcriptional antiterminator